MKYVKQSVDCAGTASVCSAVAAHTQLPAREAAKRLGHAPAREETSPTPVWGQDIAALTLPLATHIPTHIWGKSAAMLDMSEDGSQTL